MFIGSEPGRRLLVLLLFCAPLALCQLFSSVGKYDSGKGGLLYPGVETTLIDQEGPGVIELLQFASEFTGYEEVSPLQSPS